ncbi:FCS-Like Zinc finger 6-like [Wolffia australiana]
MQGKRTRAAMKRTISLSQIDHGEVAQRPRREVAAPRRPIRSTEIGGVEALEELPEWPICSPIGVVETAPFLRICGFCRQRLAPGKDIFIYRGEAAFCTAECRQRRMNHEEKMERCSIISRMDSPRQEAESAAGELETAVTA